MALQLEINTLLSRIAKIDDKIDAQLNKLIDEDLEEKPQHRSARTTWETDKGKLEVELKKLLDEAKESEAAERAAQLEAEKEERAARIQAEVEHYRRLEEIKRNQPADVKTAIGSDDGGARARRGEKVKRMLKDIENQKLFGPSTSVETFCQTMSMIHTTHVKLCTELEADFCMATETRLCVSYRAQFQAYNAEGVVKNWADFKKYLLESHKSAITIYQEMARFSDVKLGAAESLRTFAARIKLAGDEAAVVIKSKFQEQMKRELDVTALFELMFCDSMLRELKSTHKHRTLFNQIVNQLDECVTLEKLQSVLCAVADRRVDEVDPVPVNQSYLAKEIKELKSLMANAQRDSGRSASSSSGNGKRTRAEKMADPEWVKWAKTQHCFRDKKKPGSCNDHKRGKCPFKHESEAPAPTQSNVVIPMHDEDFQ